MSNKRSKFDDLFEEKEQHEQLSDTPASRAEEPLHSKPESSENQSQPIEEVEETRRGRKPTGKRSNPEWQPFTAYGRTATLRQVEVKLITIGHKNKLSDLLEDLMSEWLKSPRPPQKH